MKMDSDFLLGFLLKFCPPWHDYFDRPRAQCAVFVKKVIVLSTYSVTAFMPGDESMHPEKMEFV